MQAPDRATVICQRRAAGQAPAAVRAAVISLARALVEFDLVAVLDRVAVISPVRAPVSARDRVLVRAQADSQRIAICRISSTFRPVVWRVAVARRRGPVRVRLWQAALWQAARLQSS
jgi:hypothetical protein